MVLDFSESAVQSEPAVGPAETARAILITDDDESQVLSLTVRLEKQGYRTYAAYSGQQCLELAHAHRPNLVLLDLQLPDTSGLQVCEQLNDTPDTCGIPVIILSGLARADIVRCSRAAGCEYFVRKPYDPNALLTLIEHSIRKAEYREW